jgi:DNA polymerase-3 subunit beta
MLRIYRKDFLASAELAKRAIEGKTTIPILTNFLFAFNVEQEKLTIAGTDLEMWLQDDIPTRGVTTPIRFLINAKVLLDTLKIFSGDYITLEVTTHWVTPYMEIEDEDRKKPGFVEPEPLPKVETPLKAYLTDQDGSTVTLDAMGGESYPECPTEDWETVAIGIKTDDYLRAISEVEYAISSEANRFSIKGFLLDAKEDEAALCATDSHRLALTGIKAAFKKPVKLIIPGGKPLAAFKAACKGETLLSLAQNEAHIGYFMGSKMFLFRKITGQFPDYQRVLPKDQPHSLYLDTEALLLAAEKATKRSDERSRCVRINVNGVFKFSAMVDGVEFVGAPVEFESKYGEMAEMQFAFNGTYLIDTLKTFKKNGYKQANLCFNKPSEAMTVKADDNPDLTVVIMPMRA